MLDLILFIYSWSTDMSHQGGDKGGDKPSQVSGNGLYKLLVPLLRCDATDFRDTATLALGHINQYALSDLMEELLPYIRESIDRKQENMRRRRRRDALRLQLVKLFEMVAEEKTFSLSDSVLDNDTGALQTRYLDYIEGARAYLESENDKDNTLLQIKTSFCNFIRKLIDSFTLEQRETLIPKHLRKNMFYLFASWSGSFGVPFETKTDSSKSGDTLNRVPTNFELGALQASCTVLCCGPCFDNQLVAEEGTIYQWLDILFKSESGKVFSLAQETIVLLLEFNPDRGAVLDWIVDKCYTATPVVADSCFTALATIFSAREYPCDHYTAIMNVTLLNTGCPRANIHETALQLLQILDKRFFGNVAPFMDDLEDFERQECSTLDVLLSSTYSRSQLYLSKQLAHLHPELTMPMFSEISFRLQTARCSVRQLLLQCMLPWLYNMELVDPSIPPTSSTPYGQYYSDNGPSSIRREGWGTAEATEMVLNNLFYITVKFGDDHPKEVEELWSALCTCWPNNLRVIIRYLIIITGMAAQELLHYVKRVIVYVGHAKPDRLVEELMIEMGTVEILNYVIERTETPPFFRLTSMRKTSSHGEDGGVGGSTGTVEACSGERGGTIHTKRHSGDHQDLPKERYSPLVMKEQRSAPGSLRSVSSIGSGASSVVAVESQIMGGQLSSTTTAIPGRSRPTSSLAPNSQSSNLHEEATIGVEIPIMIEDNFAVFRAQNLATADLNVGGEEGSSRYEPPQPHPLPMPEYGGYFAPLTEYLPDSSQPITAFHRCYVAVMLLCDVIVAGIDVECHSVDWSIHVPLMLHIITLGLDHSRQLVYQHCKILLIHLLTVVADHHDHLGVARVLLNNKTTQLGYGLIPHHIFTHHKSFTDEAPTADPICCSAASPPANDATVTATATATTTTTAPLPTVSPVPSMEGSLESSGEGLAEGANSSNPNSKNNPSHSGPQLLLHPPSVTENNESPSHNKANKSVPETHCQDDLQHHIKALIQFIANR